MSCPPTPTLDEILNDGDENEYVQVNINDLVPGENVVMVRNAFRQCINVIENNDRSLIYRSYNGDEEVATNIDINKSFLTANGARFYRKDPTKNIRLLGNLTKGQTHTMRAITHPDVLEYLGTSSKKQKRSGGKTGKRKSKRNKRKTTKNRRK